MRLFSSSAHLSLISTLIGACALFQPAYAATYQETTGDDSLQDLTGLAIADTLTHQATPGTAQLIFSSPLFSPVTISQVTHELPEDLVEDELLPYGAEAGTSDSFIDQTIIQPVPSQLPPLLEESSISAATIEIGPVASPLVAADNRSTLQLAGSISQSDGQVVNRDVVITLTTSAGEFIGADYDIDRAGFQVLARQGRFTAELRSSLDAQRVIIRAGADTREALGLVHEDQANTAPLVGEIEAYTEVSFVTPLRPSLVTGVVDFRLGPASTNLWGSFREFLNPELLDKTEFDLDSSLFATGNLGDWLLTAAFNSERALNERCDGNRLYRDVQSCEQTYPVYGDSSTTDYLTPSIDNFYVRLQRDSDILNAAPDYVMWGDYDTAEFARFSQEFSAITRQLHGFKGNYTFGNGLQLTALFANNIRPFQRDSIVPDGTSGYYFLSRRLILAGSEDIFIETEELNRPGTVIERVRLDRGADYRIDYDRGSILFNQPISSVDANPFGPALVRRIIATYQVDGQETGGTLLGARAQYNFSYDLDAPSWVGASLLREDLGAQEFSLLGVDALIPLGDNANLVAEFARSSLDTATGNSEGSAFRAEATGAITDNIAGTAYFRTADSGFRNNAASSFQPGQTRWGGQVGANVGESTQVQLQVDQEINRGPVSDFIDNPEILYNPGLISSSSSSVDSTLTTFRAGIQQQLGIITTNFDYVHRSRTDRVTSSNSVGSDQLTAGLTWPIAENLTFRTETDISLSNADDPLYPGQTVVGLDWDILPEVTMRFAQRFFHDDTVTPSSITSIDTLLNYDLSANTTLNGRYSLLGGYNGITGQGAVGLNHRIVLAPGLHADLGFERVFGSSLSLINTGTQFIQPYAVGQTASALGLVDGTTYTVGLEYTDNPDFQASARFEQRNSVNGNNTVLTASAAGKLSPALTTLARFEYGNYANQAITGRLANTSSMRFGLAYRNPYSDKFNALLSYEYAVNPATTPNSILLGAGSNSVNEHTLAMEAIYAPSWKWELYGKYALRSSNADLESLGVSASNTIHLAQMRATYRFAYRWDVAGEVRYITQPATSYDEVGWALEGGYYLTPDLRLGVGYSFGSANDRSFGGTGYRTASGPYLGVTFRVNELWDQFGLQQVAPEQQEESLVEVSGVSPAQTAALTTTTDGGEE